MSVDAVDFDRVSHLAVELAVAMHVLFKMSIDTMPTAFEVNVLQMDRYAGRRSFLGRSGAKRDRLPEFFGRNRIDHGTIVVKKVPLAILLEDRPEQPTVSVKIRKLRLFQFLVEGAGFFEEIFAGLDAIMVRLARV